MCRLITAAGVAALLVVSGSPSAQAAIEIGDRITFGNGIGGPGGVFQIDDLNDGLGDDFATFCVELTEHVDLSKTYEVIGISTHNDHGGQSLSSQVAWLYTRFVEQDAGALVGFNFASPTANQANALQLAIWSGLNGAQSLSQISSLAGWSADYIHDTLQPLLAPWLANYAVDLAAGNWTGLGSVQIMSLQRVGANGALCEYAQDQLIWKPTPSPVGVVPEPAALAVWSGLALMGVTMARLGAGCRRRSEQRRFYIE